jgi:hypothetical protein
MGGRDAWDTDNHLRRLALRLRSVNNPLVYAETLENRKRALAIELIRNAFDRNQDGQLDEQERTSDVTKTNYPQAAQQNKSVSFSHSTFS